MPGLPSIDAVVAAAKKRGLLPWEALYALRMPIPIEYFPENETKTRFMAPLVPFLLQTLNTSQKCFAAAQRFGNDLEGLEMQWGQVFSSEIAAADSSRFHDWLASHHLVLDDEITIKQYILKLLRLAPSVEDLESVRQNNLFEERSYYDQAIKERLEELIAEVSTLEALDEISSHPLFEANEKLVFERQQTIIREMWGKCKSLAAYTAIVKIVRERPQAASLVASYEGWYATRLVDNFTGASDFAEGCALLPHCEGFQEAEEGDRAFFDAVYWLFELASIPIDYENVFKLCAERDLNFFVAELDFDEERFLSYLRKWVDSADSPDQQVYIDILKFFDDPQSKVREIVVKFSVEAALEEGKQSS